MNDTQTHPARYEIVLRLPVAAALSIHAYVSASVPLRSSVFFASLRCVSGSLNAEGQRTQRKAEKASGLRISNWNDSCGGENESEFRGANGTRRARPPYPYTGRAGIIASRF